MDTAIRYSHYSFFEALTGVTLSGIPGDDVLMSKEVIRNAVALRLRYRSAQDLVIKNLSVFGKYCGETTDTSTTKRETINLGKTISSAFPLSVTSSGELEKTPHSSRFGVSVTNGGAQ